MNTLSMNSLAKVHVKDSPLCMIGCAGQNYWLNINRVTQAEQKCVHP